MKEKDFQQERLNKIKLYMINSRKFLWLLVPVRNKTGNMSYQRTVYDWLEKHHQLEFIHTKYGEVINQLLRYPGIEKLVMILGEMTKEQYPPETMNKLRGWWETGKLPSYEDIENLVVNKRGHNKEDINFRWNPFLEITYLPGTENKTSSKYVERWGEYAPVYFLEIEPYIKDLKGEESD